MRKGGTLRASFTCLSVAQAVSPAHNAIPTAICIDLFNMGVSPQKRLPAVGSVPVFDDVVR